MACQYQDIPKDIKTPLNKGSEPSHSDIVAEIKVEMEERGSLNGIKVEHGTFASDTKIFQPTVIKTEHDAEFTEFEPKYNKKDIKPSLKMASGSSGLLDIKVELQEYGSLTGIKAEHATFTSNTKSFDPAVIKTEVDEFAEFETKCNEEGQYINWEEGTSSSRNMDNNPTGDDVAGSSSPYELTSKVDLDVVKMEEDEDDTSEPNKGENKESGEQNSAFRIRRVEKSEKTFGCIKCKKEFSRKNRLHNHIVTQHSNNGEMVNSVTSKIHNCKHCKYITVFPYKLAEHMRMHGEKLEKTFSCLKCEKEFSSKLCLDSHIVTRHSNNLEMMNSITCKIHRCKHCSYTTVYAGNFTQHMRTHGEKTFDCIKCRKEFSTKLGLDSHIVTQHSNDDEMMNSITCKVHRCKHCSFVTVKADYLNRHLRTHGKKPEKTFDCVECEKEFSSKRDLDGHIIARHSNNVEMMNSVTYKIHRCEHCSYITIQGSGFAQHMRTHGQKSEKTFDCIKCRKEFPSKFSLDRHIVARHSNNDEIMSSVTCKIHRCKYCSYITVQLSYFTQHMKTHGENPKKHLTV